MLNDKKKRVFVVNLLLIGLIMMMVTNGTIKGMGTAVQPGDEFTYVFNKYQISLTAGNNETSFTNYKIGDTEFAPGTDSKVDVTVKDVTESFFGTEITYELKKDSSVENGSSNSLTMAFLSFSLILPFFYLGAVQGEEVDVSLSNSAAIVPFILPIDNASDPAWVGFKSGFTNSSVSVATDDSDLSYSISSYEKDGDFYSEASFDGTIKNATTSDDLTMNSNILLVYDLSTGVLQGARLFMDGSGTLEEETFKVKYDVELFLEGFDLPARSGGGVFGFEIASTIGLLFILTLTLRKRRN